MIINKVSVLNQNKIFGGIKMIFSPIQEEIINQTTGGFFYREYPVLARQQ
jgi:hypothetical protein